MSSKSDPLKPGEFYVECVGKWKTLVYAMDNDSKPHFFGVSSRDPAAAFAENPDLQKMYDHIHYIRFIDQLHLRTLGMPNGDETNTLSYELRNPGPRLFLPGRGRFYTREDLQKIGDLRSKRNLLRMLASNIETAFINSEDTIVEAEPQNGDRTLDRAELGEIGQRVQGKLINIEPDAPEDDTPDPTPDDQSTKKPKLN